MELLELQQYLPFTVLKLILINLERCVEHHVATVPTVYGIETSTFLSLPSKSNVATVPTVYGIETTFTNFTSFQFKLVLQQYLPFTVLKLIKSIAITYLSFKVATVPTVYGIETRRWNV